MNSDAYILFVDDDEEDHLIMFEYFKDLGKERQLKFIRNGLAAIQFLEGIPDGDALPSLIVMDLNMPMLNGKETLHQLKNNERFMNIPVVIFSTAEVEYEKRRCLNLGAAAYMVKPTTYADGLSVVQRLVRYLDN